MKFVGLYKSPREDKRFVIKFEEPRKTIHFGFEGASTYLEHKDKNKRDNYIARHRVNEDWTKVNAGSLSRYILWGDSTNLKTNLNEFLKRFNIIN